MCPEINHTHFCIPELSSLSNETEEECWCVSPADDGGLLCNGGLLVLLVITNCLPPMIADDTLCV